MFACAVRKLTSGLRRERCHLGLGRLDADAGFQAPDHVDVVSRQAEAGAALAGQDPHDTWIAGGGAAATERRGDLKVRRHDANHGERLAVDTYLAPDESPGLHRSVGARRFH